MFARRIAVVGAGYVGLTTAACLASLGHHVVCADIDAAKVDRLRAGEVGILEPGLHDLVAEGTAAGRLQFCVGAGAAVARPDLPPVEVLFLCVPTPMGAGGGADLAAVEAVAAEVRHLLPAGCVVVTKSTVPVGTAEATRKLLRRRDVAVVSNPEFLREGSAVHDFLNPDRIVVGSDQQDAAERVAALYARLGAPTVLTDAASAEMVKYAANAFLAIKLSYVNALAELCDVLGADVADVTEGMGHDRRIGSAFLSPGPGWGGSCLPKDTRALVQVAAAVGVDVPLVSAGIAANERQRDLMVAKIGEAVGTLDGARIGLLGLTFKAGTDDLRDSPALAVARLLSDAGAELTGYDPGCPAAVPGSTDDVHVVDDPMRAAKDADALVVLTEWPEFRQLDWTALGGVVGRRIVVDTRNLLDPDVVRRAGFSWIGVGRR
ncbi:nucleotide sugar dehydrogenase [Pseudonocardia dioxanivorans CB1190]|uniref:UDP-glucose 6-dehydrogenase n=1 Tax=Pseudonocardia dioxanivorans (strain ATCC 55486 / DSM 44775 / JCM 13855 / CB1190) TaxID=675635 RepID=F4CIM2_PSEUX|nr:UDP-glucose/GDP-mannose dehydrogenase family protein [Pseudonocardia dioxanivorans]AEA22419.1 nucleotide sugar dehydrogenase [Pseudonocardia dioxanivorans CB1190]GJF02206.1 UDP-glucose 6-dehydrogenase [Pseudonocardia sp. D17]